MLKIETNFWIKRIFSLIIVPVLCVYILIPLLSALLLGGTFLVPKEYVLLAFSILGAMAFAVSGLLMSLIVSYFSINKEIKTTLFGVLIVVTILTVNSVYYFSIFPAPPEVNRTRCLLGITLDLVVDVVFLLGFAIMGAWLIARKRLSKTQNC